MTTDKLRQIWRQELICILPMHYYIIIDNNQIPCNIGLSQTATIWQVCSSVITVAYHRCLLNYI